MKEVKYGVKIYSYYWHLQEGLSPVMAAERLKSQGIDFVVAQNQYVPMATSAVDSGLSPEEEKKLKTLDDSQLVEALQDVGIEYWAACNVFFAPGELKKHPECRPVDQFGLDARKIDWYVGICPSCESYWNKRKSQIINTVRELHPHGVFLGFIRFPGFWELWLPKTSREDWPEFCYCKNCRERFTDEMKIKHAPREGEKFYNWVRRELYDQFVNWKTDLIANRVREIAETIKELRPGTEIMVNTLPFLGDDFSRAGREVFGQDKEKLSSVTDVFELMTYHQILGRKVHWIGNSIQKIKSITSRAISSTIQVSPYYLEGMHSEQNREKNVPVESFKRAIKIARNSGVERISFFTWADLLKSREKEAALRDVLLG